MQHNGAFSTTSIACFSILGCYLGIGAQLLYLYCASAFIKKKNIYFVNIKCSEIKPTCDNGYPMAIQVQFLLQ